MCWRWRTPLRHRGSQFFLVYGDSQLDPAYPVFGSIDEAGLGVLDEIAAAGTADGSQDG